MFGLAGGGAPPRGTIPAAFLGATGAFRADQDFADCQAKLQT
jgi:hypothetical protein